MERKRLGFAGLPPRPAILDPLVIDRWADPYRKGSRKLADMAKHYGINLADAAHDAAADSLATVQITRVLAGRFHDIGSRTPEELQKPQRKMHRDWLNQMNAWRAERNEEPWPYQPWPGVDDFWRRTGE